jgi:serine-type D-Ala-D-Ala carboxypeptidase/endopeptidase (penicillin-binding protein 4)
MLEVIGSSLLSLLWEIFGNSAKEQKQMQLESIAWHDEVLFQLPAEEPDPLVQNIVDKYLQDLSQQGLLSDRSFVWLQSDWLELANYQGDIAVSAASLTKIATTLAAIGKLGIEYQFVTKVFHTGSIQEGVLQGDLIIEGNRDPFFVWEEAIALSHSLNQLGIKEIKGNLSVNQHFYMNYQAEPLASGKLLQQGLQPSLWSTEVKQQYQQHLALSIPRPQLLIEGQVKLINKIPADAELLLEHQSLPLVEIIKQMNIYSNNEIAQMLADFVGGASAVASYAIQTTGISPTEIQLINGSGLGVENRLSPHAVTKMLMTLENLLQPHKLGVVDLFPVAGRDNLGTMQHRHLPNGVAIKTGTLNEVSALAGVIPLSNERKIWFAVINSGWQIEEFRQQQDQLLQKLANHWDLKDTENSSPNLRSLSANQADLGDPRRNRVIRE